MTKDELDAAIDAAKDICDPRGHDLLEAIRDAWTIDFEFATALGAWTGLHQTENQSHSRHAESRLRVVEDEPEHDVIRIWP